MVGTIEKLKISNDNYIYPVTVADAVFMDDDRNIKEHLSEKTSSTNIKNVRDNAGTFEYSMDGGTTWKQVQGGGIGKSAYQSAVDNGFVGTESQWLTSLKGDKGDPGTASTAIDDTVTNTTQTWSSSKIQTGLNNAGVSDGSVTPVKTSFVQYESGYTNNLFDKTRVVDGEINTTSTSYKHTDYFIEVTPGKPYISNNALYTSATYDKNYTQIATFTLASKTVKIFDANVKYVKISYYNTAVSSAVFAQADAYTFYYPYGYIPEYKTNDFGFKSLVKRVSIEDGNNLYATRATGRYSGAIDLTYTRSINTSTTNPYTIRNIADTDDWYSYGVKQVFNINGDTTLGLQFWTTGKDGTRKNLTPQSLGYVVGDTIYVGFLIKPSKAGFYRFVLEVGATTSEKLCVLQNRVNYVELSFAVTDAALGFDVLLDQTGWLFPAAGDYFEVTNVCVSNQPNSRGRIIESNDYLATKALIINERYKTKKILALGDSITNGGKYLTSLNKLLPYVSLDNQGIGGLTLAKKSSDGTGLAVNIDNLQTNVQNADVITIFAGTNDANYIPSGVITIGSLGNGNISSVIGAYEYIINKVLTWKPNALLILITPYQHGIGTISDQETITNAIITVSEKYRLTLVNLYHHSGINTYTNSIYTYDGTHQTDAGGDLVGRILANAMKDLYIPS